MSNRFSTTSENGGRCESCNEPGSVNRGQSKVLVFMGGGVGMGDMWMCTRCLEKAGGKEVVDQQARDDAAGKPRKK